MSAVQYRLSHIQEGMLFHHIQNPHSGVDIEQLVCGMPEAVAAEALGYACQRLVDRHGVLRTRLDWEHQERPMQSVEEQVEAPFQVVDLSGRDAADQRERFEGFLEEDRIAGVRLDQAPLCRFTLFKLGASDYKLILTFHHVAMDGRSFPVILNELLAEYEARREGKAIDFPAARPYSEYIGWLDQLNLEPAQRYWGEYLKGFVLANQVPQLDPSNVAESGRGEQEIALSVETTDALRAVAKSGQVTLNTIVQGVWGLLLSRYTASTDVVFGATRACRGFAQDTANMVGTFINTLPVRVRVDASSPIGTWLEEIRKSQLEIREYEHTPLASVQSWSEIPHGTQLFETLLVFDNFELGRRMQSQGGHWSRREVRLHERTNFPLTVYGYASENLLLRLAYDRERFSDASVRRMLGHLRTMLEALPAMAADGVLADVPMLTAEEQRQLREWNETGVEYPRHKTVHQLIEEQVDRSPGSTALIFRNQRLSYQELDERANQLARLLLSMGLQPGDRVAVSMERSLDLMVALLATLKAGGAYVPLDPTYPAERMKYVLEDARASIILTEEKLRPLVQSFARVVVAMDAESEREALEKCSRSSPRVDMSSESAAYVIYTSGSTGKPKGVVVNHSNVVNFFTGMDADFGEEKAGVWLAVTSISFDISVLELFWTLARGFSVVLQEDNQFLPANPDAMGYSIPEQLLRHQVTHMQCTPSLVRLLAGDTLGREALASLRKFLVGGEALPLSLASELQQIGVAEIYNMYGPTETTIWSTLEKLAPKVKEITIGRPIANTSVFVLDANRKQVPVGVAGELYIGGEGVVPGYLDRPQLTAERFVHLDFANQRAYRTGDLVKFLPDGRLYFLGRVDHQVKIRGHRIEMGEIEAALNQHPSVLEAIVATVDYATEGSALVAYVVGRGAVAAPAMELRKFLEAQLPSYMVPSTFVPLDAFPRTPNGKIDRKLLPHPDLVPQQRSVVPPRNPVEEKLAAIWGEALHITDIGIRDNFFDLGGHSLLLIRLISQIQKEFGQRLPVATVLEAPTIEALALVLGGEQTAAPLCRVIPLKPQGTRSPFICLGASPLFLPLARLLGRDQPFCGLDLTQLKKINLPEPCKLEDIATFVVEAILEYQPEGPYLLGGWCLYGVLAYEAARQLTSQGHEVQLLTLMDSPNASYGRGLSAVGRARMKTQKWLFHLGNIARLRPAEMLRYTRDRLLNVRNKLIRRRERVALEAGLGDEDLRLMDLDPILFYAATHYDPPAYEGRVLMVQSSETPNGRHWQMAQQWRKALVGKATVYEAAGSHEGMFKYPNVETLAAKMRPAFEQLGAGSLTRRKRDYLPPAARQKAATASEPVVEEHAAP